MAGRETADDTTDRTHAIAAGQAGVPRPRVPITPLRSHLTHAPSDKMLHTNHSLSAVLGARGAPYAMVHTSAARIGMSCSAFTAATLDHHARTEAQASPRAHDALRDGPPRERTRTALPPGARARRATAGCTSNGRHHSRSWLLRPPSGGRSLLGIRQGSGLLREGGLGLRDDRSVLLVERRVRLFAQLLWLRLEGRWRLHRKRRWQGVVPVANVHRRERLRLADELVGAVGAGPDERACHGHGRAAVRERRRRPIGLADGRERRNLGLRLRKLRLLSLGELLFGRRRIDCPSDVEDAVVAGAPARHVAESVSRRRHVLVRLVWRRHRTRLRVVGHHVRAHGAQRRRLGDARNLGAQVLLLAARERRVRAHGRAQLARQELADRLRGDNLLRRHVRQHCPLTGWVIGDKVVEGVAAIAWLLDRRSGRWRRRVLWCLGRLLQQRLHHVVVLGRAKHLAKKARRSELLRLLQRQKRRIDAVRLLVAEADASAAITSMAAW
mmetsp:Transcript_19252/g.49258  ORF Transcript_19252/g.49258 Transcript_19252/m.49258 type:complete len:498 (-) Transcript_19252:100-1593(-)